MKKLSIITLAAISMVASLAMAGDVLWFYGHNGFDGEGHADIQALLESEGAIFDLQDMAPLPDLGSYGLIFIVMPGFFDATDFFTADEKERLNDWLTVGSRRVVMVGEWDGFYGGQAVMEDLLAAIGNPIEYVPGAWDTGCSHCSGALGNPDPLTDGLSHVCYAYTATWDPAAGVALAYPEAANAPGPYIVSNGTDIPCIVGIGDGNVTNDLCGHISQAGGDMDSMEFHRRLYNITCAGEVQSACCLPNGSCVLLTDEDCADLGGVFYPELDCGDVECAVGTENSTWSTLKEQYR